MISERQVSSLVPVRLAEAFDVPRDEVVLRPSVDPLDFAAEVSGLRLDIEYKGRSDVGSTLAGLRVLQRASGIGHPVLMVPFMGEMGASLCAEQGVSWVDLSGNARVVAPGVRIILKGFPNKFVNRGRPSNPFAPKSARVTRELLRRAPHSTLQSDLATATGLGTGFVSRIVRRLMDDGLVGRSGGDVTVPRPDALLAAWAERYDLFKHRIVKGHISAESSVELVSRVGEQFAAAGIRFGFTGLPSAWLRGQHTRFRLVTVYAQPLPARELLDDLGFREGPRGANVWFIEPNDAAILSDVDDVEGVPCVSAAQTYLDLLNLPERAEEAAEHLKNESLTWGSS